VQLKDLRTGAQAEVSLAEAVVRLREDRA
jgi:hypothetical protein